MSNHTQHATCQMCKWYYADPDGPSGECRRHAPTNTRLNQWGTHVRCWPEVLVDDICGDFELAAGGAEITAKGKN